MDFVASGTAGRDAQACSLRSVCPWAGSGLGRDCPKLICSVHTLVSVTRISGREAKHVSTFHEGSLNPAALR